MSGPGSPPAKSSLFTKKHATGPTVSPVATRASEPGHRSPVPVMEEPQTLRAFPAPEVGLIEISPAEVTRGRLLGSGTSGEVFEGRFSGHDVAVKIMRFNEGDAEDMAILKEEVELMKQINHKNCLRMIAYYTTRDSVVLVLERCQKTLQEVSLERKMSQFEVLNAALGIASGMAYLHGIGVVHRDLKAANVLVTKNFEIKVADFGLSKVSPGNSYMNSLVGTVSHMAPEILSSSKYKGTADVYSFAIVIWQCLAGQMPYANYTAPLQVINDVVTLDIRPQIPKGTNPDLERLINRCWVKDPHARPTFAEIEAELKVILENYSKKLKM